jgi:hypothetical protein
MNKYKVPIGIKLPYISSLVLLVVGIVVQNLVVMGVCAVNFVVLYTAIEILEAVNKVSRDE